MAGTSQNAQEFRHVFVVRVHELLDRGYQRMIASAFANEAEPAITGELVKAIRMVLDDPTSEDWVDRFSVHDDPPVNMAGRVGKRRQRVDIRVESAQRRPRCQFSIEAKRLGPKCPLTDYLGDEGLGCFLSGAYAADELDAGMLAYVQSESPDAWATRAGAALAADHSLYSVIADTQWVHSPTPLGPPCCFRSGHNRTGNAGRIDVYHTFLSFQ